MTNNPITFHAEWWAPDGIRRFSGERHTGTLSYNKDEGSTLKVYHRPSKGVIYNTYEKYDVLWGESADGNIFTLFNVVLVHQQDFTSSEFTVNYVLLGMHLTSIDSPVFDTCVTDYKFLKEWAFSPRISQHSDNNQETFLFDMGRQDPLFSVEVDKGILTYGWGQLSYRVTRFDLKAEQITSYNIDSNNKRSIKQFLLLISEFSEFLSIAMFCPQYPQGIELRNTQDNMHYSLLFKVRESARPMHVNLIKYEALREKLPAMLKAWHANHDQVAPIASYLIRSMRSDTPFDSPDFLIIAEALDGYFKRFENRKDGRDTRKYKDGIDKLLDLFCDIDVIQHCHINSSVVTDSRDKYSHLYPDEEQADKQVVAGVGLYWLTQKCKILLTCCILKMIGLNNAEINTCCNNSPISYLINAFPMEV